MNNPAENIYVFGHNDSIALSTTPKTLNDARENNIIVLTWEDDGTTAFSIEGVIANFERLQEVVKKLTEVASSPRELKLAEEALHELLTAKSRFASLLSKFTEKPKDLETGR